MKNNLLWASLLIGLRVSFAQSPYVLYYAIDQLKMEGYAGQSPTGNKSFELMYQKVGTDDLQTLCYTWGCMITQVSGAERKHIAVDQGLCYDYDYNTKMSKPTTEKAQGVYIDKSPTRKLALNIKTYAQGALACSESQTIVFDSDLPRYLNAEYKSTCKEEVGILDFKGVFKGTMAMVSERKTLPYISTPVPDPLHIGTATVTIKAPDFMTKYFKPEEIAWFQDGKDLDITGHQLMVSTQQTLGSLSQISQTCDKHAYAAVVKKFNWHSGNLEINFSPNVQLGKDILLFQPLCQLWQAGNDPLKHNASLALSDTAMHRIFNISFLDSNNKAYDDKTLEKGTNYVALPIDQRRYNLGIREYLEPNPMGGDIYSCEQLLKDIVITSPPPLRIAETQFTDILCYGEHPSLKLRLEGNTDRYTLSYGDTMHTLHKGLQNVILPKGTHDYDIKISDAKGCVYDSTIHLKAIEPTKLQATVSIHEAHCHDSNAVVHILAHGGKPYPKGLPYRYAFGPLGAILENDSMILKAGTLLSPKVFDSQGCSVSLKDTNLRNPVDFRLDIVQHTHNRCAGDTAGSIRLQALSTDESYSYQYSQNGKKFTPTSDFDSLPAGFHTFYVQNQMGCMHDTSIHILQAPPLQIHKTMQTDVRCKGERNGSLTVDVKGGSGFKRLRLQEKTMQTPNTYSFNIEFSDLHAGNYWVYVCDSLGCTDSAQYSIGIQSQLRHKATLVQPSCAESSNGAIEVQVLGAVAPYHSDWLTTNVSGTSLAQSKLGKGTYILRTIDDVACVRQDTFILNAPAALKVRLEGYPVLCKNQSLELDAGPVGIAYEWSGSKGFKANTRKVTLVEGDVYTVKVTDQMGCSGKDTFILRQSDVALKADFLVASTVVQGDTVVLVNNNAYLDSLAWGLDTQNTRRLQPGTNTRSEQVVFLGQGEHQVQMTAYYNGCRDVLKKKILVVDAKERSKYESALGITHSVFQSCTLFPNPNDGHFEVHMTLHEPELPVALVLSSMSTGSILKQIDAKSYPDGKVVFEEELPEGPYVLHVKARDEILALRFLVAID